MRNVKQDLADLAQKSVPSCRMNKLSGMYGKEAARRRAFDGSYRPDSAMIDQMREIVARTEAATEQPSSNLPVTSVYNALQIVKMHKSTKRDVGLRALQNHLQRSWERDREANLTAESFNSIRDYYSRNYPRSKVSAVIEEIGQRGYVTLPISDLLRIASKIRNQEDFDVVVKEYGLHTNQPHAIKARRFILGVINDR